MYQTSWDMGRKKERMNERKKERMNEMHNGSTVDNADQFTSPPL
jgi:hypothetical protein